MNVINILSDKPIAFHPCLAKITGSVKAGLFLSQLLYWWGKRVEDGVWKTVQEFAEETTLTKEEQLGAIKRLKGLGIIRIELKKLPARRYFYVNEEKITELLSALHQDVGKPDNWMSGNPTTIYTENTTENTNKEKEDKEKERKLSDAKEKIIEHFNKTMGKKIYAFPEASSTGLEYWLGTYGLEQILEAIDSIKLDEYWGDKMTIALLFRMTNSKNGGQAVDYIGQLLSNVKESVLSPKEADWKRYAELRTTVLSEKDPEKSYNIQTELFAIMERLSP
jgi:hypothetical protein